MTIHTLPEPISCPECLTRVYGVRVMLDDGAASAYQVPSHLAPAIGDVVPPRLCAERTYVSLSDRERFWEVQTMMARDVTSDVPPPSTTPAVRILIEKPGLIPPERVVECLCLCALCVVGALLLWSNLSQ